MTFSHFGLPSKHGNPFFPGVRPVWPGVIHSKLTMYSATLLPPAAGCGQASSIPNYGQLDGPFLRDPVPLLFSKHFFCIALYWGLSLAVSSQASVGPFVFALWQFPTSLDQMSRLCALGPFGSDSNLETTSRFPKLDSRSPPTP